LSTIGHILILENKERVLIPSGWITAFFVISGIVVGVLISLEAVAAFYSLFYIAGVLPTCMIHLYIITLGHSKATVLRFWAPKIILSLVIWLGVFYRLELLTYSAITGWIILLSFDMRFEFKKAWSFLFQRLTTSGNKG
jgi:hypothetical protein